VVAASDSKGGIYHADGFSTEELAAHKACAGRIDTFRLGKPVTNRDVLTVDCDILIPAALERAIDEDIAKEIKAPVIAEGANGPITPGADEILNAKGATVVPDILANAGGVTVSYFEWVQGLQAFFWSEEEVNERLEAIMVRSFGAVWDKAKEYKCSLRMAAYLIAVQRVAEATNIRGIYP
jgi:glutamate dehydrogenase (NAD(P)+)